jgi:hypothetical protein
VTLTALVVVPAPTEFFAVTRQLRNLPASAGVHLQHDALGIGMGRVPHVDLSDLHEVKRGLGRRECGE